MKHSKRIWLWFVSEEKAYNRKSAYIGICAVAVILAFLCLEFFPLDPKDIPSDVPSMALIGAILLAVTILAMLFITHLIIFSIQKNREKKRKNLIINDIPGAEGFTKIVPINKGWSDDKKYFVEDRDGRRMLLRVSGIREFERKKAEYGMMKRVYAIGVLTPEPLGFGLCNSNQSVYSLSGWLPGEDAAEALPRMNGAEQYALGIKAGEVLRRIHTLPAPEDAEPWGEWFYHKVQGRIDFYNANPLIQSASGGIVVRYLQDNRRLLDGRPQTFSHGDYNVNNLLVMPGGEIGVIDFNYFNKDHGDPWWEFDPFLHGWGSEPSAYFHSGMLHGYFNREPPREFFELFSYYQAYDALAALCETSMHHQGEPETGRRHLENVLRWYDGMKNPVPTWYLKELRYAGAPRNHPGPAGPPLPRGELGIGR